MGLRLEPNWTGIGLTLAVCGERAASTKIAGKSSGMTILLATATGSRFTYQRLAAMPGLYHAARDRQTNHAR